MTVCVYFSTLSTCVFHLLADGQLRARFADFLQTFSKRQNLWSFCSVVFHALTLKLPIQTSLSVAPKLQVCVHSGEKCQKFRKTSTVCCTV